MEITSGVRSAPLAGLGVNRVPMDMAGLHSVTPEPAMSSFASAQIGKHPMRHLFESALETLLS